MEWHQECSNDKEAFVRFFLKNLMEELTRADEFLDADQLREFRNYYKNYYENPLQGKSLENHIRGYIRGDLGYMLNRLVNHSKNNLRILDAGSGPGTQSILFSLNGNKVHGIDLREDRYTLALERHKFYEKELNRQLDVKFGLTSIFNVKEKNSYDIVWISNAISHIDPVEKLLDHCYSLLKPGGEIIIVDLNGLNIFKQLMVLRERGLNIYKKVKDPGTGGDVTYAVERILTYPNQCALLKKHGFLISHRECFIGYHSKASEMLYKKFIKPINQSFLISSIIGGRYVVVGRKV